MSRLYQNLFIFDRLGDKVEFWPLKMFSLTFERIHVYLLEGRRNARLIFWQTDWVEKRENPRENWSPKNDSWRDQIGGSEKKGSLHLNRINHPLIWEPPKTLFLAPRKMPICDTASSGGLFYSPCNFLKFKFWVWLHQLQNYAAKSPRNDVKSRVTSS